MNETKDLASWIIGLRWGDIPGTVVDYAKILILEPWAACSAGRYRKAIRPRFGTSERWEAHRRRRSSIMVTGRMSTTRPL